MNHAEIMQKLFESYMYSKGEFEEFVNSWYSFIGIWCNRKDGQKNRLDVQPVNAAANTECDVLSVLCGLQHIDGNNLLRDFT